MINLVLMIKHHPISGDQNQHKQAVLAGLFQNLVVKNEQASSTIYPASDNRNEGQCWMRETDPDEWRAAYYYQ